MGASKRVCEMIVQAQSSRVRSSAACDLVTCWVAGAVVPVFEEQIRRGGPITLTHPEAQRFLMTIPEAVGLLLQAGTLANNRDIVVLDMGQPVFIQTLAHDLIELSGLSPHHDVRIEITELKSGEKLSVDRRCQ
jgi:FlaA1/EpsC-like NDP-sugar epimerase